MSDRPKQEEADRFNGAESDSTPSHDDSAENLTSAQYDSLSDAPVTSELVSGTPNTDSDGESSGAIASSGAIEEFSDSYTWSDQSSGPIAPRHGSDSANRWWSAVAMVVISLVSFLMTSVLMAAVAVVIVSENASLEMLQTPQLMEQALAETMRSRLGLFISLVIPQLALVAPCLLAAVLSPIPFARRLGLVRGRWPIWSWLAVGAVSPLVGIISGLFLSQFVEESDSLRNMSEIFRNHGTSGFFLPLAFMIGVTPAFCEELLFRGYIQQRLTRSFRPWWGIVISSFLFAAFHMDWVHVLAVFPLGLFLGWATWRSGSLLPAMVGHFVNNFVSVIGIVVAPNENQDTLGLPAAALSLSVFGFGLIGFAAIVWVARRYKDSEETDPYQAMSGQRPVDPSLDQNELNMN